MGTDAGERPEVSADPPSVESPSNPQSSATHSSFRFAIGIVLVVLTTVMLMASTVAVWAQATVFDSDNVADIVSDALAEPEVEAALAAYISEQVLGAVDVDARVSAALPDDLERLQPVITAGLQSAVERGVTRTLTNPEVHNIVVELVERAHRRAMDVLQGDGLTGAVPAVEGEVSINLLPLIGRGLTRLQELGRFDDLEIPELTADGDPAQQIADLEAATGRDLPGDFGQLVVYESDRLADGQASLDAAQQALKIAKRAVWLLVLLTTALAVVTLLVVRDKRRGALWLALGAVVAMIIIRSAVQRVVDEAPDLADKPGGRAAISAIVTGASTSLFRLAGVILLGAAAVAAIAMSRRHWRRADVALGSAVATFVATIAVLGLNIPSLLFAIVAGLATTAAIRRLPSLADQHSQTEPVSDGQLVEVEGGRIRSMEVDRVTTVTDQQSS